MTVLKNLKLFLSLTLAVFMLSSIAHAQDAAPEQTPAETLDTPTAEVMDMPALSASVEPEDMTHPIMRMTPDKSELVKLEEKAASVIVGNPNHISVLLDTPNTLVVVPRKEGASHFTVLAEDGSVLMQRHVVVGGGAKKQYVRIRRSCGPTDRNCKATSTYFCPDMCHEVTSNEETQRVR